MDWARWRRSGGEAAAEGEVVGVGFSESASDGEEDADFVEVAAVVVGEPGDAGELSVGLCADDPGVEDEALVCGESLEEVGVGDGARE